MSSVQAVDWVKIMEDDAVSLSEFSEGIITIRDLRKAVSPATKRQVTLAETLYGTNKARSLARRALRRRNFA